MARFPNADNQIIAENEALLLTDTVTRKLYSDAYAKTSALYYSDKPNFKQTLSRIGEWSSIFSANR